MAELTCRQCRQLAAELALDILPARERAGALRHLDDCDGCRDAVRELTGTADRLVELAPEAAPPAGFEQRVLSALTSQPKRRPRVAVRAAAVLGAVLLVVGGWLGNPVHRAASSPVNPPDERLVRYAPLVSQDQQIGQAYFYPGNPPWIYLSLATASSAGSTGSISCEAVHPDGTTSPLGSFPIDHGQATWAGPAPASPDNLVAARLVDQAGHTLALARFAPPRAAAPSAPPAPAAPPVPSAPAAPTPQTAQRDNAARDSGGSGRQGTDQHRDQHSADRGAADRGAPDRGAADRGAADRGAADRRNADGDTGRGTQGDSGQNDRNRRDVAQNDRNGHRTDHDNGPNTGADTRRDSSSSGGGRDSGRDTGRSGHGRSDHSSGHSGRGDGGSHGSNGGNRGR